MEYANDKIKQLLAERNERWHKMSANGWGLTKFKKYQIKKIKETFFKFCLSPCYVSVKFLIIIFCEGILN